MDVIFAVGIAQGKFGIMVGHNIHVLVTPQHFWKRSQDMDGHKFYCFSIWDKLKHPSRFYLRSILSASVTVLHYCVYVFWNLQSK